MVTDVEHCQPFSTFYLFLEKERERAKNREEKEERREKKAYNSNKFTLLNKFQETTRCVERGREKK